MIEEKLELRINYGFNISLDGKAGSSHNFILGRSYLDKKQEKFDEISGFSERIILIL